MTLETIILKPEPTTVWQSEEDTMDTSMSRNQEQFCDLFARDTSGAGGSPIRHGGLAADLTRHRRAKPDSLDIWRDAVRRHSDARAHWRRLLGNHLVPHPVR